MFTASFMINESDLNISYEDIDKFQKVVKRIYEGMDEANKENFSDNYAFFFKSLYSKMNFSEKVKTLNDFKDYFICKDELIYSISNDEIYQQNFTNISEVLNEEMER